MTSAANIIRFGPLDNISDSFNNSVARTKKDKPLNTARTNFRQQTRRKSRRKAKTTTNQKASRGESRENVSLLQKIKEKKKTPTKDQDKEELGHLEGQKAAKKYQMDRYCGNFWGEEKERDGKELGLTFLKDSKGNLSIEKIRISKQTFAVLWPIILNIYLNLHGKL